MQTFPKHFHSCGDKEMNITNYHTHTSRCLHASNSDEEYVLTAIRCGYKTLGFSDHTPWPYMDGFKSAVRMECDNLDDYVCSVRKLQGKYKDQIEILLGLECEYYPEYYSWLKEQQRKYKFDYLILGNHFARSDENNCHFSYCDSPEGLARYVYMIEKALSTKMFSCLAHPDVVLSSYPSFDIDCVNASETLCELCNEHNIPMEYNLQGVAYKTQKRYTGLNYPCKEFWSIAGKNHCQVIIGVDAHRAESLSRVELIEESQEWLSLIGCRVTDTLRCNIY